MKKTIDQLYVCYALDISAQSMGALMKAVDYHNIQHNDQHHRHKYNLQNGHAFAYLPAVLHSANSGIRLVQFWR